MAKLPQTHVSSLPEKQKELFSLREVRLFQMSFPK